MPTSRWAISYFRENGHEIITTGKKKSIQQSSNQESTESNRADDDELNDGDEEEEEEQNEHHCNFTRHFRHIKKIIIIISIHIASQMKIHERQENIKIINVCSFNIFLLDCIT